MFGQDDVHVGPIVSSVLLTVGPPMSAVRSFSMDRNTATVILMVDAGIPVIPRQVQGTVILILLVDVFREFIALQETELKSSPITFA